MSVLCIDIGYGHTKVLYNNNEYKFPSAVSYAGISSTSFSDSDSYEFEGQKYFVGDNKAVRDALATQDYSFLEKYAPLLIFKAIEYCKNNLGLDDSEEIHIATGLSVLNWANREGFKNRIRSFTVNNKLIKTQIKLFAQGQGVFYDYFGCSGDDDLNIVFDIGLLTNDFIVFENNKPYPEKCFANNHGVNVILKDLQNYISSKFNEHLSEVQVNNILITNQFRHYGVVHKLDDIISQIKDSYIEKITLGINSSSKGLIKEANKIILSGGGAYLFNDYKIFPNMVLSNSPYEFSNVRGYAAKAPKLFSE